MATTNTAYAPGVYNTGIVRGDTFREAFSFSTGGVPVSMEGAVVRIQIRTRGGEVLGSYSNESGIEVGETNFVWTVEGSETAGWAVGSYLYDVEISFGSMVRTYATGAFVVQKDITQ